MKLPNEEYAIVRESKIRDYLLSGTHLTGKAKARFWKSVGYSLRSWRKLQNDLVDIGRKNDINGKVKTEFGMKYIVDGVVESPSGRILNIRTVWIIEKGKRNPVLITAYPR